MMVAFLIYLSVMGNAAAVVALALHLEPGLPAQILMGIGAVPLSFGLTGFGVFAGEARDDYRRRSLERFRKRMSEDPAGIALRAELEEEGRRKFEERTRQRQIRIERIDAELGQLRKYKGEVDKAYYAEVAERGPFPVMENEFWAAVVARRAAHDARA